MNSTDTHQVQSAHEVQPDSSIQYRIIATLCPRNLTLNWVRSFSFQSIRSRENKWRGRFHKSSIFQKTYNRFAAYWFAALAHNFREYFCFSWMPFYTLYADESREPTVPLRPLPYRPRSELNYRYEVSEVWAHVVEFNYVCSFVTNSVNNLVAKG